MILIRSARYIDWILNKFQDDGRVQDNKPAENYLLLSLMIPDSYVTPLQSEIAS